MKQTRLWIGTIAMLLCNLLPIHAENVVVRLGDWTSTNHSHNSTSSKTYTFTAVDGAILSFDWWVDNGFSGDLLIVTLDGTTILEKGGYQSGTCNKAITQGEHTLVVKYTKDGSASSGLDQARVSNLTIAYAIDGLVYSTANNTASVIGAIDIAEVVIPSNVTINDTVYIVASIGDYAFHDCSSLTSITIPESVTSIGNYAFDNCTALKKVIIEDGNTTLSLGYNGSSQGLFYDCPLEEVYLGRNLSYSSGSSYGYSPFYKSNRFPTISLGNNVTSIPSYLFYNDTSLTSITIPESVTSIGNYAFDNCTALKKVIIEDGSTTLSLGYNGSSQGLFYDCPLEEVYLGRNLSYSSGSSYGYSPFYESNRFPTISLGNNVTSIPSYLFYNNTSLISITIPENVTSIGNYAFDKCTALKKVIIEDGSTTLSLGYNYYYSNGTGQGLFYDCPLEEVYLGRNLSYSSGSSYGYSPFYKSNRFPTISLGNNVTSFSSYLFYNDTSLTAITIPESVTSIGGGAFSGCSGLTSISIPESVTSIGSYAFEGCSSLTSITIPESVTSIGNYAFDNCTALKKVIIEDGSTTLSLGYNGSSQGLFYDCPLEEVYLGRNLSYSSGSSYGYSPFYNKDALTNVTIGNEVTQISQYVFYGCDNIHSLTIPSGVLSIGSNAFSTPEKVIWLTNTPPTGYTNAQGSINYAANDQHSSLSNLRVYPYLSSMFEVDGVKYVPVSPSERTCHAIDCAYNSTAMVINVGETAIYKRVEMKVMEVMPYTFYGNDHIKEVNISHKGNISDYAFYDCDSVQSVELSNEGNVGSQAFYDCDGIKSLDISNVGYVGDGAFRGCGALETAIVANIGTVNGSAFYGCASLNSVTLGDKVTSLGNEVFRGCTSLQEIVIPDSVKSVGTYCFYGCTAMKSAVIGDGLTDVKEYTFANCSGLESVTIGNGVTSIRNYSFSACSSLNDVEIGSSVATINNYAFQGCSSLPTITIPQAVTTVGDNVFAGCSSLADVVIADRTEPLALGSNGSSALFAGCPLDSVYIGGKITYNTTSSKGYSPFYRNTSLRTVVITDREEQIYDNEFYGCTNLQNVTIGNGVKSIGDYAFSGCSSLEGFSFGSNMESIGAEAFSDCTSLTSITSHAAVPPTCGTQALDDINKWECVLGVPLGNADAYYAADQWKEFFFIEDVVEVDHYVLTYVVDGEVVHTEVLKHKDEVTMLAEPTKVGYEFSGWDKTLTTMPAEDVIISGTFTRLPVDNLVILDTEENFLIDEEMECETVTYIRHFDDTQWQALYLPFAIPYDSLYKEFEVAYINDMHQFDDDNNGTIDRTEVEAIKIVEGMLKANYPYLIKAKSIGEKSIVVADATLYATEENSVDCSSVFTNYTFTGSYSTLSGEELAHDEGYYVLSDGMWQPLAEGASLGAFRIYLKIESRDGNNAILSQAAIRMRVVGDEENEDDATGIENSTGNGQQATVYDLQGRKVLNTDNLKGIYIVDGKKVVFF